MMYTVVCGQQTHTIHFTTNNGLPSSECYQVTTDRKGYIWVATDYGVSCFDGRRFRNFTPVQGMPEQSIIRIEAGKDDKVWFACTNGYLGYISDQRVFSVAGSKQLMRVLSKLRGSVVSLKCDQRGDVWVGTSRSFYVLRKDEKHRKLHEVQLHDNGYYGVFKQLGSKKWIESTYKNDPHKMTIAHATITLKIRVFSFENRQDRTMKLTFDSKKAINPAFHGFVTQKKQLYLSYNDELFTIKNDRFIKLKAFGKSILCLLEDKKGNLLLSLSNGGGVLLFENGNLQSTPVHLLSGNTIGSICEDKEGGLWFTGVERGLFYIPLLDTKVYANIKGLNEAIESIGYANNCLFVINNKSDLFSIRFSGTVPTIRRKTLPVLSSNARRKIIPYKQQYLHVGSLVVEFNSDLVTGEYHRYSDRKAAMGASDVIGPVNGRYYGISYQELCEVKNQQWNLLKELPARGNTLVYSRQLKKLLVGTKLGLFVYNNESLRNFQPNYFEDQEITALAEDRSGTLYVGTKGKGVYLLKAGKWQNMTEKEGLVSNYCRTISVDSSGVVFLVMHGGVHYFRTSNPKRVRRLTISNGLFTNEVIGLANVNNHLFVGTKSGLISLSSAELFKEDEKHPIYLKEMVVNNRPYKKRFVDFGANSYRFYIDILAYKKGGNQRYQYQLRGLDELPKKSSHEFVEYTKIPPGTYELWVSEIMENGKAATPKKLVKFTVLAPFWQQWWFLAIVGALIVLIIVLLFRWRLRFSQARTAKRNELMRRLAESQIIALRAQMNPHFIFNAINSIQDFVLNNNTQEAYDYLAKFARLIRLVMQQSNTNFLSLEKEIDWLRIYIELEQLRFRDRFEFILTLDPSLNDQLDISIPNMLIQPHLENAIWHGIMPLKEKRLGKVLLSIRKTDQELEIIIEDNGVGRSEETNLQRGHVSNGIKLVTDRLEKLRELDQLSFHQEIIDLVENNQPAGTRVVIHLYGYE